MMMDFVSFGDDVEGPPNKPGVWEIQVHETFEEPPASDAAKNEQADFILLATMGQEAACRSPVERT